MKLVNLSRRGFVQSSGVLVLGASLPLAKVNPRPIASGPFSPNVYLSIDVDGTVTVTAHRSEMGQGIRTALAQIIADELDADWARIVVDQAPGDKAYGDQNTDGSQSIRLFYDVLRRTGASAKQMLTQAAANHWGVDTSACRAIDHEVVHAASGRRLGYGELAADAAALPIPNDVVFKPKADHRYIGQDATHVDMDDILNGTAKFGADVRLPNMVYAVLVRSPWLKGQVQRVTPPDPQPGYLGYEVIDPPTGAPLFLPIGGVAILAEDTYTAVKIADTLDVQWSGSDEQAFDSEVFTSRLRDVVQQPGARLYEQGNVDVAFDSGGREVEALYESPFLSHAPMEPPCAVAHFDEEGICEVFAPVQDPQGTRNLVAGWLQVPETKVRINVTLLGGAFGRKSKPDFVVEAVELAKRLKRPVRVQWRREDDIKHDFYHAASAQYHRAVLDNEGMPTAWLQRTAFPSITTTFSEQAKAPANWELEQGFSNLPYRTANQRYESIGIRPGVRVGWMRSVCNIFHAFSANSFVDEMAHAAGMNTIDYQLALLGDTADDFAVPGMQAPKGHAMDRTRLATVVQRVRALSEWDRDRGEGRGLGFAVHHSFRSYVATVLDVSVQGGQVKVHDAFVAMDCGTYINPNTCTAQVEGAVMFGLSLALMGEITVTGGVVQQSNFHDYPVVRMSDAPNVHVDLIDSDELPAGVGEPGVPPVAPALTNAVFAASGQRVRKLPVRLAQS